MLRNELGDSLGYLDRYGIEHGRHYVTGWTTATQVALMVEGVRTVAVPTLTRRDVTTELEPDQSPDVGFYAGQPVREGRMQLCVALGDHRYFYKLPLAPKFSRAARRRLLPRFLADLLRASPAALRWKLHGRPEDRAAAKRILRLSEDPGRDMVPSMPLFLSEGAEPDQPIELDETEVTIVLPIYIRILSSRTCPDRTCTDVQTRTQLVDTHTQTTTRRSTMARIMRKVER